jgi:PUA domain protein
VELLSKKDTVQQIEIEQGMFLKVNGTIAFFYHEGMPLPTIHLLLTNQFLPTVTVDMGAVRFVVSGADIMRPGITAVDDSVQENGFVAIIDENNKKPLALGRALLSAEKLKAETSGNCVKNLHRVGDKIWKVQDMNL